MTACVIGHPMREDGTHVLDVQDVIDVRGVLGGL